MTLETAPVLTDRGLAGRVHGYADDGAFVMTVAEEMGGKLRAAFSPDELEIIDESHLHRGHAGAPEGGESHFRVRIVSVAFAGMSRLDRQRAVHQVLREELAGPVHALSVVADAPAAV